MPPVIVEPTVRTMWKLLVIGFGGGIFTIGYMMITLVLWNRNWSPFRAKQPFVLLLSLLSATCWWIGNLQALGVIDQTGIFSNCALWGVWAQIVLGVLLYLSIMVFRMLRLFFILVLSQPPQGLYFWTILGCSYLPGIMMGLVPLILPGQFMSVQPVPIAKSLTGEYACDFFNPFYGNGLLLLTLISLCLLIFLNYKVSRVREAFNEYRYQLVF